MEISIWREYQDEEFIVLGISSERIADIQDFIEDQGITFPVLHDPIFLYYEYNLPGGQSPYPRDFVVDRDGIIQYANPEFDPGGMIQVIESLLYPDPEPRTVLAELFGATWCHPCSIAYEAIDSLAGEFGPDSLVVLEYHWVDEYSIPEGEDRARWYVPGSFSTPNMWFDGTINVVGAQPWTIDIYRDHILDRLQVGSDLSLALQVGPDQAIGSIRAVRPISETNLKAYFVLFENQVDGRYDYVVRDILPSEDLAIASVRDSVTVARTFDIDSAWNAERMGVALFVQSDSTKAILQSTQKLLAPYLFVRGDASGDGAVDVGDVVHILNYLFKGQTAPDPLGAADANCDGEVNLADAIYILNYLFRDGPPPAC
jgi:hypothetical protein